MNNKFDFLKDLHPDIYKNISCAVENEVIEPDITAYKIRKSLEYFIKILGEKEGIELNGRLYDNINELYKRKILNKRLYYVCEYIRNTGNIGVHASVDNVIVSDNILKAFFDFSKWFVEKYDNISSDEIHERIINNPVNKIENRYSIGLNDKEKDIFDSAQRVLYSLIEKIIIDDKNDGVGFITDVKENITFEEYHSYYLLALKKMINYSYPEIGIMPGTSLKFVLAYRKIAKKYYGIGDDFKINKILAKELYKHTHWYLLQ